MELQQMKNTSSIKWNNYQNKGTLTEWVKVFDSYSMNKRFNIQNVHRDQHLSIKRTSSPINKWANELSRQFSEEAKNG
jgi:hypothetical protein